MIRQLSRYFPTIPLAIVFSVLPFQPLYGSSLKNCQNVHSASTPSVSYRESRIAKGSAGTASNVAFAPDRIIVKFRDSVTEAADVIHGSGARFAHFTATHGEQLDELNSRFGVKSIAPLFQPLRRVQKDDGRLRSRESRKGLFADSFKQARSQHPKRSARVAKQAALPDLSHIYVVTVAAGTDRVSAM
jgi:hypothetical protein